MVKSKIYEEMKKGTLCPHCLERRKSKQSILCPRCSARIRRLEELGLIKQYIERARDLFTVVKNEQ